VATASRPTPSRSLSAMRRTDVLIRALLPDITVSATAT
jgi:hypothetical protein